MIEGEMQRSVNNFFVALLRGIPVFFENPINAICFFTLVLVLLIFLNGAKQRGR